MTTITVRSLRTYYLRHPVHSNRVPYRHHQKGQLSSSLISLLSQRRDSSSATTSTNTSTPPLHSKVNGPISTLPAALNTPERQPGQSLPSHAFSLGKSYLNFYKIGLKAIYTNFIASRPIQARLDTKYNGSLARAIDAGFLDRSSFQLLTRSWFDMKRIPLFALVVLIFGELTPLVVIAFTSVVPYTCRIPKQIESDRKKLEKRRAISFRNLTAVPPENKVDVDRLERMQLLHISWSLGLSSSAWDWLGGRLPGLPTPVLRRKVRRRIEYLEWDDKLIKMDGGVEGMSIEEARMALVERGVDILGKSESQLRAVLKAWLQARNEASTLKLLLTRPSVWPPKK